MVQYVAASETVSVGPNAVEPAANGAARIWLRVASTCASMVTTAAPLGAVATPPSPMSFWLSVGGIAARSWAARITRPSTSETRTALRPLQAISPRPSLV